MRNDVCYDTALKEFIYHHIDAFGSRTTSDKIWFNEALNTPEKRFRQAQKIAKAQYLWKIQVNQKYLTTCNVYMKDRIE